LKAIGFIINTNIFLALAAVSLSLATQAQLGMSPEFHINLLIIFFATIFDYNLHRYILIYKKDQASQVEKYNWAIKNQFLLKSLIIFSSSGLVISLFFTSAEILFLLLPLASLSFMYSIPSIAGQKDKPGLLGFTSIKTFILAFIWASATVLVPVFQTDVTVDSLNLLVIFTERFAFIFAIAIPFDIRDMQSDALAGRRTIPLQFGEKRAMATSNYSMLLVLIITVFHNFIVPGVDYLPALIISAGIAFIFLNNKKLKQNPFYYHGILDGSLLVLGLLTCVNYYLYHWY
jgi:4-hydroxybenzoate polyprenyltransferase